jgi:hypothetical protein
VVALLYVTTAAVLLALAHRYVTPLTRGSALALVLLPLCFTGRAVLTDRIYAPVEMAYIAQPLSDHAPALGVPGPHNPTLSDIAFQMLPWREATRRAFASAEWPLLNRFQLCGDVLAGAAQPAVYNPFTLIACLLPPPLSVTFTGVITFVLAALGAFLFARELGCSAVGSMFAAAGWMFSGPIAGQLLWPQGFAWTLLPLVLLATHRIVRAPDRQSVALLTFVLSLEVLAGHPETLLHVTAIGAVYGIGELVRTGFPRRAIVAAIASGLLALGLTAIYLLPFLDAVSETRDYAMRTQVYAHIPLPVPAGYVRDVLLGNPFPWLRTASARLPEDIACGSIIVALAIYSVIFVRARRTWFFVALFVVSLLVGAKAWPLAHLLHAAPLFSQSLNERMATAAALSLSMLAAFAIDRLAAVRAAGACVALLALYAVVAITIPTPQAGLTRLYADLIPLAVAAVILFARIPARAASVSLFALLLAQRIVADGSLVPVNDPGIAYPRLALLRPLDRVREPFRIAGTGSALIPNTATMYGLEDVRGHTPITFGPMLETFPLWSTTAAGQFHSIPDLTRPILSMLNLRFAVTNVSEPIPPGWREVSRELNSRLVENERVLPRAFVPRNVRLGTNPQEEVNEMAEESDFSDRAWLQIDEPPHDRMNGGGTTSVARQDNGLRIDVSKDGDGFVVISQLAWRGWRAYVDGQRVTTHRANHAFLAVFVPNGRHTVDLRYLPQSFVIGRLVTFATFALIAMFAAARRTMARA